MTKCPSLPIFTMSESIHCSTDNLWDFVLRERKELLNYRHNYLKNKIQMKWIQFLAEKTNYSQTNCPSLSIIAFLSTKRIVQRRITSAHHLHMLSFWTVFSSPFSIYGKALLYRIKHIFAFHNVLRLPEFLVLLTIFRYS